jgi:hypothetical protein
VENQSVAEFTDAAGEPYLIVRRDMGESLLSNTKARVSSIQPKSYKSNLYTLQTDSMDALHLILSGPADVYIMPRKTAELFLSTRIYAHELKTEMEGDPEMALTFK